jgi:hypothetical protein
MNSLDCPSINMERYWNLVATPLLVVVISFGLFVLFKISSFQTTATTTIFNRIAELRGNPMFKGAKPPASAAAPAKT